MMGLDLNKVWEMMREQFNKDEADPYINKPYSHTLYTVWRKLDEMERSRNSDPDDWTRKKNQGAKKDG